MKYRNTVLINCLRKKLNVLPLLLLFLWEAVVWITAIPSYILPSPTQILQAFWQNSSLILWHAGISLGEVVLGLTAGIGLGIASSDAIFQNPFLRRLILPPLVALQAVPTFALLPLLLIWFGYGLLPKIMIVTLCTYFPVTTSLLDGLDRVPSGTLDLGIVMRATPQRILWKIRFPYALPSLISGIRIAAVHAPLTVIAADWIGANAGLGYLMMLTSGRLEIELMFACIMTIVIASSLIYKSIDYVRSRLLFWQIS